MSEYFTEERAGHVENTNCKHHQAQRDRPCLYGFSSQVISNRFGSWGALRQVLGLNSRAKIQRHYTDDELIEDMYRVYRRYRGRPISHQHKRRGGKISPGTIRERFGSWEVAKAGLKAFLRRHGVYNDQMPLPVADRELFDEIRYVGK